MCLGFKWRAVLNGVGRLVAWVLSLSPPEFTHEDLKSRFDWLRWSIMATYGVLGFGSFCYVHSGGLADFAPKNLTFEDPDIIGSGSPISSALAPGVHSITSPTSIV